MCRTIYTYNSTYVCRQRPEVNIRVNFFFFYIILILFFFFTKIFILKDFFFFFFKYGTLRVNFLMDHFIF